MICGQCVSSVWFLCAGRGVDRFSRIHRALPLDHLPLKVIKIELTMQYIFQAEWQLYATKLSYFDFIYSI